MNLRLQKLANEIDLLIDRAKALPSDEWLISHWAKYVCVRSCGFLEEAVTESLIEFVRNSSSPRVQRYVHARLQDFQNPKMTNIYAILERFDPLWSGDLRARTLPKMSDSVNAIVSNRHKIAHGEYSDISLARATTYWEDAKAMGETIWNIVVKGG